MNDLCEPSSRRPASKAAFYDHLLLVTIVAVDVDTAAVFVVRYRGTSIKSTNATKWTTHALVAHPQPLHPPFSFPGRRSSQVSSLLHFQSYCIMRSLLFSVLLFLSTQALALPTLLPLPLQVRSPLSTPPL